MKREIARNNDGNDNAGRRTFLKNLSVLSAAGGAAAMLPEAAHADPRISDAQNMRLAQAEESKPKPKPKPQITATIEKGDFKTLQEIVHAAKRNLPPDLWTHLVGGSDSETTIRRNRMAFETLALRQRVLVNVNNLDTSTTFLGQKLSIPLFICPVGGYTGLANPQGVLPVVRGAEAAGGEAGVRNMLELMAAEIRSVMGLIGATSVKELTPSRVKRAMAVHFPSVTGAFPWFEEQMRA